MKKKMKLMQYLGRFKSGIIEAPLAEQTSLSGFRLGPPQTDLHSHRRSFKVWIWEEGLYYLCSKKKGTDQLCSYCAADLHLCFRICKNHDTAQIIKVDSKSTSIWPDQSFVKTWVLTDLGGPRG